MSLAALAVLGSLGAPLEAPWRHVAPGVEMATAADLGGDANWAAKVLLVDPQLATFAVRFDAQKPTLAQWRQRYPGAIAIGNASFYSADGGEVRPTCDIVQEGRRSKGAGCLRQDALWFGARQREVKPAAQSMVAAASRAPRRRSDGTCAASASGRRRAAGCRRAAARSRTRRGRRPRSSLP